MGYLTKAKAVLSNFDDCTSLHQGGAIAAVGVTPNDKTRHYLMRIMVDWNERAAMMTRGDLTVEQAEIAAWRDLELDKVFFGIGKFN